VRWFLMRIPRTSITNALPLEQVAHILARACGHWGSGAQYLHQTVSKLEEFGIHDENLWKLQELVAEEIKERKK
jgi:glutathione-specific gamma-glutamylcyclotransferase